MEWKMRNIDQLQFHRARLYLKDGTVCIGKADCVCDASEGDGQEKDGIAFDVDGEKFGSIFTEDDIDRFELLD